MKRSFAILALLAILPASAALAGETCSVPPAKRQSFQALARLASEFEWTIDRLKIDDGCYELRVTDTGGNILKVRVDPATLELVDGKVKRFGANADAYPAKRKSGAARH